MHYLERAVANRWWISFAHDDKIFTAHVYKDEGKLRLGDIVGVPSEYDRNQPAVLPDAGRSRAR
jgi:hypothetical protein